MYGHPLPIKSRRRRRRRGDSVTSEGLSLERVESSPAAARS